MDLLRFGFVRSLVRWRGFPSAFQFTTLLGFLAVLWLGWGLHAPEGASAKLYAKSNLVNLLIWGLWWPAMIWAAVLLGRAWCAVCPLELVSGWAERTGRRMGVKQRAYCRGFCPVGLLLGTYGRGSMLAVRAAHGPGGGNPGTGHEHAQVARSCPSLLNPPKLDSSKDCLICGQCVKASRHGEMSIRLGRPFPRSNSREALASWPVTLFVILVSGFVTYELTTNWPAGKQAFLWAPSQAAALLGPAGGQGWLAGVWQLVIFPLLLWVVLGGVLRIAGSKGSLASAWRSLALPAAVLIAAGHMAKGLEKMATWGGYLPQALSEPSGVETVRAYSDATLPLPVPLASMAAISVAGLLLLAIALAFALRELRLAGAPAGPPRTLPLVLLWAGFSFLVARWGLIP